MKPQHWPAGADIQTVAMCARGCEYCLELLKVKRTVENEESVDGKHRALDSFAKD